MPKSKKNLNNLKSINNMDKLALAQNVIVAAKTAQGIVDIPEIQSMWIQRYEGTSGKKDGNLKFENEKLLFLRVFQDNPKLEKCDPFSKYMAFMDLCTSGLTLAESISYIFSMDNKTVMFMPSWKGRLEQMKDLPDISFVYDPEVAFDCDDFLLERNGPQKKITHTSNAKGQRTEESKPIHVYMYIEFTNGKVILYEMPSVEVLHIRDTKSKSYINYVNALKNDINKGKKFGDRVTIQYKDSNQQWAKMDIDPPMGVTDIVQYFKKTLVRRVWGTMKKLPSQKALDQKIDENIKTSTVREEPPIASQMPENAQVDEVIDEPSNDGFTDYEEVGGENIDKSTGEVLETDEETF